MPRSSQLSLWSLSVLPDHNLQLTARLSSPFTAATLSSFLQDNLSLHRLITEEDPVPPPMRMNRES
jgi:hypothetical protein